MNFTKKPTDGEFNEVFYNRKRIGSYKSIPLEIKKELMDYFLKVLMKKNKFHYVIVSLPFPTAFADSKR